MGKKIRGTYEWAKYNENCVNGCSHLCQYCYARNRAIKSGAKTPKSWHTEVIDRKAMNKVHKKRDGRIMFPTRHDISPQNLSACAVYLERMLSVGNEVLIVSKPHLGCIQFICEAFKQYQKQIMFRFTIGSVHNSVLKLWEPGAPRFEERLNSLKFAFEFGYKTSVSCEPMLDGDIHMVVNAARNHVTDAIWLGKANNLIARMTTNGADEKMLEIGRRLVEQQCDENIWKLYEKYKDDPIIKWKESIKEIVGLELPTQKGTDK